MPQTLSSREAASFYDHLRIHQPLPNPSPLVEWFTTRSIPSPSLREFALSPDGRLYLCLEDSALAIDYDGPMYFTSESSQYGKWEYRAEFQHGRCVDIELVERTPAPPIE